MKHLQCLILAKLIRFPKKYLYGYYRHKFFCSMYQSCCLYYIILSLGWGTNKYVGTWRYSLVSWKALIFMQKILRHLNIQEQWKRFHSSTHPSLLQGLMPTISSRVFSNLQAISLSQRQLYWTQVPRLVYKSNFLLPPIPLFIFERKNIETKEESLSIFVVI